MRGLRVPDNGGNPWANKEHIGGGRSRVRFDLKVSLPGMGAAAGARGGGVVKRGVSRRSEGFTNEEHYFEPAS
jgi:hypothetical protein